MILKNKLLFPLLGIIIVLVITSSIFFISINYSQISASSSFLPYAECLSNANIINTSSTESGYRLNDYALRQEVAAMMMSISKVTYPTNFTCTNKFSDVSSAKPNTWVCKIVETALLKGLIAFNSIFRPEDNITRAEALAMILKGKGMTINNYTVSSFSDVKEGWQRNVIETALSNKIISANKYFRPSDPITRGELFVITTNASGLKIGQTTGNQILKGKCGDGICDTKEKANSSLCPKDCTVTDTITTPTYEINNSYSGSPFGAHPAEGGNDYIYARDLGIKWDREGMYFVWNWIDASKNGKLNFTQAALSTKPDGTGGGAFNYDQERAKLNVTDIEMMVNICPFRKGGEFGSEEEKNTYQKFVEKTVERYDGDGDLGCTLSSPDCYSKGDSQYPSNDLISKFKENPIKYWQLCNQVNDTCGSRDGCLNGNYATKYAEALKLTYEAVKKSDSSASVLIAGDSEKDLYPAIYKELNGKYIDIIDFHRFSRQSPEGSAWYNPKDDFNYLIASLQSSGFDVNKLRFWITETSTYSGDPMAQGKPDDSSYQSEKQQSAQLLKVYVSALSYKIEKVFWAWSIVEGFQKDCGFFDYTGLIYDGYDCVNGEYAKTNSSYDLGEGVKKLAYYTYKKMTETLDGSDWNNTETIQESDGVYIYKFTKNNKPIWVAWNDNTEEKQITISGIVGSSVVVTEAIPKYESGEEVSDYSSAFNKESKTTQSGKITLTLKDVPVFIQ